MSVLIPLVSLDVAYSQQRPNIVWIVSEDNAKHYMRLFNPEHGVETPNLARIAQCGVLYANAFSNAPVSSAARSTIITGCYGPRLASHYHRGEVMADVVDGLESFPAYLKQAGYYTVNNAKEDYNVNLSPNTWDESSRKGSWRNREKGQPFFYVHNLEETHEGKLLISADKLSEAVENYSGAELFLQPNYPDTKIFRDSYKLYCQRIETMDRQVGDLIAKLEEDNLLESTIIFYYGDNGGILPNSKGYLTEVGLNVPLIVCVPQQYEALTHTTAGDRSNNFVSFVDLAPTCLSLAGVDLPEGFDGRSIFDSDREEEEPIFGYADRMGEKYDMVRSVRRGKYKYVRNFQPFNFDALTNGYRYKIEAYQELREMYYNGELNTIQEQFFKPKSPEMLFDIESDPYEVNNLAADPQYRATLISMRAELVEWQRQINDLGFYPEFHLIECAYPSTATYGVEHSDDIDRYIDIANLSLEQKSGRGLKRRLKTILKSDDPWDRYWALTTTYSVSEEVRGELYEILYDIAQCDSQLLNRVRAAELLALDKTYEPQHLMLDALYSSENPIEAAMILNSMAVMNQQKDGVEFDIEPNKMDEKVMEHSFVKARLLELQ
ncbi:MAG: sulfatase [Rikenellaceae bacterium]